MKIETSDSILDHIYSHLLKELKNVMKDPVEVKWTIEPNSLFHFENEKGYKLMEGIGTSF